MGIFNRTLKDGSKIWGIDYYFNGKRIRERVGPQKSVAKKALESRKGEIAQGKFNLEKKSGEISFKSFSKKYLEIF